MHFFTSKNILAAIVCGAGAVLISACGGGGGGGNDLTITPPIEIKQEIVMQDEVLHLETDSPMLDMLDDASIRAITADIFTDGELRFMGGAEMAEIVTVGAVIVVAPGAKAEDGLYRVVTSAREESGDLAVMTRQAGLGDIIEEGEFVIRGNFDSASAVSSRSAADAPGARQTDSGVFSDYCNGERIRRSLDSSLSPFAGCLGFSVSGLQFEHNIDISDARIDMDLRVDYGGRAALGVDYAAGEDKSLSWSGEIAKPRRFIVPAGLIPIPVWYHPFLLATVSVTADSAFLAGLRGDFSGNGRVAVVNNDLQSPTNQISRSLSATIRFGTANTEVGVQVGPIIRALPLARPSDSRNIHLGVLVGGTVNLDAVKSAANECPAWTAGGRSGLFAGANLRAAGVSFINRDFPIVGSSFAIPDQQCKTCADGTTIPPSGICMKTCEDGSTIAESAECPEDPQSCVPPQIADENGNCFQPPEECGNGDMFDAVQNDNLAAVNCLIAAGAAIIAKDNFGRTPLCYASNTAIRAVLIAAHGCYAGCSGTPQCSCTSPKVDDGGGNCICPAGMQDDGSGGCEPDDCSGEKILNNRGFCVCPAGMQNDGNGGCESDNLCIRDPGHRCCREGRDGVIRDHCGNR